MLAATSGDDPAVSTVTAPAPPPVPPSPSASSQVPVARPRSPAPRPSAPRAAERPPTLVLRVTGARSWIRVLGPGDELLLDGTLVRGERRRFDQRRLRVTVGDAAAVQAVVNGEQRRQGGRGEIARFTVER